MDRKVKERIIKAIVTELKAHLMSMIDEDVNFMAEAAAHLSDLPPQLNKVEVTNQRAISPGSCWLLSHGFRIKLQDDRVFLVRDGSNG